MLIHDSTPSDLLFPRESGRGLDLSARPEGFGAYAGSAEPFPAELLVPRSEWQARIEEMESDASSIPAICDQAGLPVKDQLRTNFCWFNAPTHCVEILRVMSGLAPVVLSAASGACQVTGFRNVGGWGKGALDWIAANGVDPDEVWPNAAIDRRYLTPDNKALAAKFRVTEWWELDGSLDQLFSCLFLGIPVAIGLSWWEHEVTAVAPKWVDGAPALQIDNSWGQGWGDNGRGILQGSRMVPDDAVAPRVVIAT